MSIRIVLADDHAMVRQGLRAIIERDRDIEVIGEAGNGAAAVEMAGALAPDVVVMDINMPDMNGIEAARQITARRSRTRVIALSAYADRHYVLGMLDAGACGYILKASVAQELVRAIREVTQGRHYLSAEISGVVVKGYTDRPHAPPQSSAYSVLSARERQVLQLLAEGKSAKDTAVRMNISTRTVETHRRNIMKKLDLHTIATLTKYAIREGITRLEG